MPGNLVDDWFGAFRNRDIAAAPLADDFTHTSPFGTIEGRQTYLNVVGRNEDAFYDATIEILDVIERPGAAAVRYLVDGSPACDVIYGDTGLITRVVSYYHVGPPPTW